MKFDSEALASAIRAGDRAALGRAITLVESSKPDHRESAQALLTRLSDRAGGAIRVGVSGPPGVGKSTFIEALGKHLTSQGQKLAVLAVDPSSSRTQGSILGDKTRMAELAGDPNAFIRPSPSSGALGGAGRKTREAILVCEGAGFDIVIVETVGVGQSETLVADMTDSFVALMLPGAGDELQGVKKGIIEIADILVVNKADGSNADRARRAANDLKAAIHILESGDSPWTTPVLTCSALERSGVADVWETVTRHQATMREAGLFDARRRDQRLAWLEAMLGERVMDSFHSDKAVRQALERIKPEVADGVLPAGKAADELLETWRNRASTLSP